MAGLMPRSLRKAQIASVSLALAARSYLTPGRRLTHCSAITNRRYCQDEDEHPGPAKCFNYRMYLGIEAALVLGLAGSAFSFVPYIAAVITAVPATLFTLAQGPLLRRCRDSDECRRAFHRG